MKQAWFAPSSGRQQFDPECRPDHETTGAAGMIHRCDCGTDHVVIPKEIPLANDEQCLCASCGCEVRGRWSSRYFDYEPFHLLPEEEPHDSAVSQNADRIPSGLKNS
jgi:hypothetical protein